MHFTGRTWRPPYEANYVIIQAASGCTYGKCRFCSLYKDECFRMSPMEEFEEDLAEIKSYQPYARRIFWTESGDDGTLTLAGKGYTAADILEQCRKLDEAEIEYYFVYMTGLAGKDRGYWNAVNSAKLFSRLNPYFISIDSLTLFPDTELYRMEQEGQFANSSSNFYPVTAYLPKERDLVVSELQYIMDTVSEEEMVEYRRNLKSLG